MRLIWILLLLALVLIYHKLQLGLAIKTLRKKANFVINFESDNQSKDRIIPVWYSQKIPFKIHQTSFSKKMDYQLANAASRNHYMNPEYEYCFYDDAACVSFIQQHFPEYMSHYHALVPGAYKADLFRLLVLYQLGGVYIDDKTFCTRPLRELIRAEDELILVKDNLQGTIYQGVLFAVPFHPLMKRFIDRYIQNIEARYYGVDPFDIGGPRMVGRVLNTYLNQPEDAEIHSFTRDGIRVEGNGYYVAGNRGVDVLALDDKKIYFERSNPTYVSRKIKQVLSGREYLSLWALRKVYR